MLTCHNMHNMNNVNYITYIDMEYIINRILVGQ